MEQDYYTRGEKEFLLKIARAALEKFLVSGERFEPQTVNQKLWEKRGCFVTLWRKGELRGCIGLIEPVESLILAVRDNVLSAARDPRFLPVDESELDKLEIEISILTEPEKTTIAELKEGDGVVIKRGNDSATFLPQVWEDLSEREEFFRSLCHKAGVDYEFCNDKEMEFFRYGAIVFKEGEI